jgi:hypothetical protein
MLLYLKKIAALGFLLFIALWVVGVIRGFTLEYPPPPPAPLLSLASEREYVNPSNSNYAQSNMKQLGLATWPLILDKPDVERILIDDKRAFLTTGTTAFKDDEAKIRAAIAEQKGRYFADRQSGIEPARRWTVEVGVHPDKFDALVENLRGIGKLATFAVEKKDRTNEFRKLHAQRQSLKKHLESITKLREGKNPSLEDSLKLEQKILDIEKELQGLGVQFGELLGDESYYHVQVTLVEYQPGDRRDHTFTIGQRIGSGFMWALTWWLGAAAALAIAAATCVSIRVLRQKSA